MNAACGVLFDGSQLVLYLQPDQERSLANVFSLALYSITHCPGLQRLEYERLAAATAAGNYRGKGP